MMHSITAPRAALLGLALATTALPAVALAAAPTEPSPAVMKAFDGLWTGFNGGAAPGAAPATPGAAPAAPAATPAAPKEPTSTVNDRRFPPALEARLTPRSKAAYLKFKGLASNVIDKEPPTPDNNCMPFAIPGETVTTGWPMMILVTPKVVGILMQIDTQLRIVHMNEEHPANLKPSFHGHSVGHWEGDTLVIDTIGFDSRAQFTDGFTHGPNLHAVERYRIIEDGKIMEKTFTFSDPDALSEPYSFTRRMRRTDKPFQEYLNAQNNTLYECPTAEAGAKYQPVH